MLVDIAAVTMQQAYVDENKVNLLAANHNLVEIGVTGSGIYGAYGDSTMHIARTDGNWLIVAEVTTSNEKCTVSP